MSDKKVLVVDDEFHIVQVVAIKLRNNGYTVITADNGADAYSLACAEKPDVIITDYQMPQMSGLELIEKLRETESTREVPVLMLTARGFAIEEEQKKALKIAYCLSKPFSPREVLQSIESVLHQDTAV